MCEITNELKKIVGIIPDDVSPITLDDLKEVSNGIVTYELVDGIKARSRGLYSHPNISMALTQIPDKGHFPFHIHKSPVKTEIVFVLEGILKMTIGNKVKNLHPETIEIINTSIKHDATAIGDVLLVAITIPKDAAFPE